VRPELAGGALLDLGVYVLNFASMVFGDAIDSIAANCVKLDSGVDAQENIMLTYRDGKMASLYCTMLAQTDRRGLINGTNGYIEIENINNYEMVRVFNLERKIVAEYTAPTQITGYEYEVQSVMRAIREGRIECPEMPHAEILRMMQLMDSIRGAWGIEFPFEKDNTVRITASPSVPGKVKKEKSVVRKISEKSVSDTEYENTEKPKATNAKDAREQLPQSPHKGITDKLPKGNIDFAAPKKTEAPPYKPKKLKEMPVLKKPEKSESEKAIEEAVEKHGKVLEEESIKRAEEEKIKEAERLKKEAEEKAAEEARQRELAQKPVVKKKSPTEQLFELGIELSSIENNGQVGSVTDKIRGLTIEEEKKDDIGSVTDQILELDVPEENKNSDFQRRRSEPSVRSWNANPAGTDENGPDDFSENE
jgi:hypothetical protein